MGEWAKVGWVFLGAGIGGVVRHLIQVEALRRLPNFPWGTLAINIVGSLLIGLFLGWDAARNPDSGLRHLVATGLLGGFTTFSAFSADAVRLGNTGHVSGMLAYVAGSVVLSVCGCALGVYLTGGKIG